MSEREMKSHASSTAPRMPSTMAYRQIARGNANGPAAAEPIKNVALKCDVDRSETRIGCGMKSTTGLLGRGEGSHAVTSYDGRGRNAAAIPMPAVQIDDGRDEPAKMIDRRGGNSGLSPEPAKSLAPQDAPSSEDIALEAGGSSDATRSSEIRVLFVPDLLDPIPRWPRSIPSRTPTDAEPSGP
jgi:hypothetical protein